MPVETVVIGLPANDYALSKQDVSPQTVQVRGAGHRLDAMVRVVAPVDVSDKQRDFEIDSHLVAISDTGAEMHDLAIEPADAKIKATLVRQMITAQIPVIVSTSGELPTAKSLKRLNVCPRKLIFWQNLRWYTALLRCTPKCGLSQLRSDSTIDVELELRKE